MLRTVLARTRNTHGEIVEDNNTTIKARPQITMTNFLSPITPTRATSQSRATQVGFLPGHYKGITIDRATANCRVHDFSPVDKNLPTLIIDK